MASPKPGQPGDQAHLTHGSVRWHVARRMRLGALSVGSSGQYAALLAGGPVTLTADQVRGFLPAALLPANLDENAAWRLTGDDSLEPVA
jgi:hypothetical protein